MYRASLHCELMPMTTLKPWFTGGPTCISVGAGVALAGRVGVRHMARPMVAFGTETADVMWAAW